MRFYVAYNALCASACVPAFLHSASHLANQNARFYFHQGEVSAEGLLNVPYLLRHGDWPTQPVYMDEWVNEISPRLVTYLGQCTKGNLLRDTDGITLTWRDITLIAEGNPRRTCDEALVDEPR